MNNCLFSIIVPVYKVPYNLLHRSIQSVITQSYKNIEIILIDDGSPDECGKICDEYAQKDNRIKVIHQQNGGLSVVRNVGVEAATGEWVSFVDGDDFIETDTYEEVYKLVKKYDAEADVISWDGYADFDNGISRPINFFKDEEFLIKDKNDMIDLILPKYHTASFRYVVYEVTWARVYRRQMLKENGIINIPGLARAQDLIFNLEVLEYAKGLAYTKRHLYHYVMQAEAATKKYDENITKKMVHFSNALKEYVAKYHNQQQEFYQRAYVKIMPKIVECFAQKYVPYSEKNGTLSTLKVVSEELDEPVFREAVEKMDGTGNIWKMKVFQFLLKNKLYYPLFLVCKLNLKRKEKWFKKTHKL